MAYGSALSPHRGDDSSSADAQGDRSRFAQLGGARTAGEKQLTATCCIVMDHHWVNGLVGATRWARFGCPSLYSRWCPTATQAPGTCNGGPCADPAVVSSLIAITIPLLVPFEQVRPAWAGLTGGDGSTSFGLEGPARTFR